MDHPGQQPAGIGASLQGLAGLAVLAVLCLPVLLVFGAPSRAEPRSENRVAVFGSWGVFVETEPRECWAVAAPAETRSTRNNRPAAGSRCDVLLFATWRPGAAQPQFAYSSGHILASPVDATLMVDRQRFRLPVQGSWAWTVSVDDDQRVLEALKQGSDVVITARSARGMSTRDTFSLDGFAEAVEDARKRCTQSLSHHGTGLESAAY